MLELAILGLLKEQPLHGYELKKRLGETLGFLWGVSYGSLYPALRRLERSGAIESVDARAPPGAARADGLAQGRPGRGPGPLDGRPHAAGRRTRKAYRITDQGEALFVELLLADDAKGDDEKAFALKLAFCRHLARRRRLALLERRRDALAHPARPRPAALRRAADDRYTRVLLEHRTRSTAARPRMDRRADHGRARSPSARRGHDPKEPPHERPTPPNMSKVRVAIAGVGNCASSLVQGVEYYRDADPNDEVPGLMHVDLGGYHVGDVEFVAAFDVDAEKVGLDLGKADLRRPATTRSSSPRSASSASLVQRGADLRRPRQVLPRDRSRSRRPSRSTSRRRCATPRPTCSCRYLPVGSEDAQRYYAQACLDAGVAFVNAIPVFIASDPEWAQKFTDAGVPIVGDDIKSQVGATIVHRILARLFEDRGARARPHVPAQLRRQHGLQEHARARAAEVEEDLEDPVGDEPDRPRASRPTTCTSARRTTCRGSTTASGPTSASRAATSATCR